jgi:hypothetical protein
MKGLQGQVLDQDGVRICRFCPGRFWWRLLLRLLAHGRVVLGEAFARGSGTIETASVTFVTIAIAATTMTTAVMAQGS